MELVFTRMPQLVWFFKSKSASASENQKWTTQLTVTYSLR